MSTATLEAPEASTAERRKGTFSSETDSDEKVVAQDEHLQHVEQSLASDRTVPSHDIALALA